MATAAGHEFYVLGAMLYTVICPREVTTPTRLQGRRGVRPRIKLPGKL